MPRIPAVEYGLLLIDLAPLSMGGLMRRQVGLKAASSARVDSMEGINR